MSHGPLVCENASFCSYSVLAKAIFSWRFLLYFLVTNTVMDTFFMLWNKKFLKAQIPIYQIWLMFVQPWNFSPSSKTEENKVWTFWEENKFWKNPPLKQLMVFRVLRQTLSGRFFQKKFFSNDLSIALTKTKYTKLNTRIQNISCCLNENLTTFLYTLTGGTRKQKERKKSFLFESVYKSWMLSKKLGFSI